ncbi:hypothetical protein LWI29_020330 [Acer saccharum]|uniref:ATP-dependent RNA helicase n=1 Tax=Acer saccharum TaxID=4024 RepID=A0AA39SPJ1_ACESA|nr:hypothetical protein LWI29_020330 [Acer saccharum]
MVVGGTANLFDRQSIMEMMIDERPTVFAPMVVGDIKSQEIVNCYAAANSLSVISAAADIYKVACTPVKSIKVYYARSIDPAVLDPCKLSGGSAPGCGGGGQNKQLTNTVAAALVFITAITAETHHVTTIKTILVNAATGTGKTVTYLAPIIHHLQDYTPRIDRSQGTFALVLVPTHELCMRVYEILQKLLHSFHWIVPGISILVATPGRLLDHLKNTSSFVHTNLRWIIFDEADRILEKK